jgi:3-deoxy-D-manno-octulosonic-acid transferase
VTFAGFCIKILAVFNPKMEQFVEGRKNVFETLANIDSKENTIWFHAASLGEYEQGLPVMEKMKINYPDHKIVLTFFRLLDSKFARTIPLQTLRSTYH